MFEKACAFLILILLAAGCISQDYPRTDVPEGPDNNSDYDIAANITVIDKTISTIQEGMPAFDYYRLNPQDERIKYPLLLKYPVVKSPMPYYVFNKSAINFYKYNLTLYNLRLAFDHWENATENRVRFVQVNAIPEEGIVIEIVPSLVNYTKEREVIGEAAPVYYDLDRYSLIIGGKMLIFPLYGGAENRVTVEHEIGHIMGLGHNSNPHSVLYPTNIYSQEITPEIIEALDILYRDVPEQR